MAGLSDLEKRFAALRTQDAQDRLDKLKGLPREAPDAKDMEKRLK